MTPTYYVQPLTYRGHPGFRIGSRGGHGWPISIWTPDQASAQLIRDAYNAARDGHITDEERDALVDATLTGREIPSIPADPTPGELAHPGWAYRDANGFPLVGPCHIAGCPYGSLPGGGDNHASHEYGVRYDEAPDPEAGPWKCKVCAGLGAHTVTEGDGGIPHTFRPPEYEAKA